MASYFFWNQGNEMQKSNTGLVQWLLYQILKSAPELIPKVCPDRLHHEAWEMDELIAIFNRITAQTQLDAKFCFFIDGLDEYNGDEQDVVPMLQALSGSGHIKICASSRPERTYENLLPNNGRTFDIARYTKEDMRTYVQSRLQSSIKFQKLASAEPSCGSIIADISNYADGVWLWVFLVTRDIIYEVERDEGITTLRRIVDEFPSDLEKYFARIIEGIKERHKEEMAQTFLVTVHELQPLPLLAFALLDNERSQPDYAIKAPIRPTDGSELAPQYPVWRSRVQNRCGDLLVVDDGPHPLCLSHSVDFLHRTVRDFLRDCYHAELKQYLKTPFNPLISLCRICLALLKMLPVIDFRDRSSANRIIGLTDELLYYANEVERNLLPEEQTPLVLLLDELDTVNSCYAHNMKNHWTHARDSPASRGLDVYKEGGQCNFLALAVQARLVRYVRAKLQADKRNLQKRGRPLLDYALRSRRVTPITMPYHPTRDDPSVDIDMVEMLLGYGADPNQRVHIYDGKPVWALFVLSIHESDEREGPEKTVSETLKTAWYRACKALIKAGAQLDGGSNIVGQRDTPSTSSILDRVFGQERATVLRKQREDKANETQANSRCWLM